MHLNKLTKAVIVGAIALTGGFEGSRLVAYQDSVGVWTACFGETHGIEQGDTFTPAQCDAMFAASLNKHNTPLADIPQVLPPNVHIASLDLAYNIGTGAFKRSTLYRHLLNADYSKACAEIPKWRFAGGKDCADRVNNCYGIVKRRAITTKLCFGEITLEQAVKAAGGKLAKVAKDDCTQN